MIKGTKYVRLEEMDLTSGSREFEDLDEDETEEEVRYKELNWKQKILYQLKNW